MSSKFGHAGSNSWCWPSRERPGGRCDAAAALLGVSDRRPGKDSKMTTVVDEVLIGQVRPLGKRAAPSGIDKRPVPGRLALSRNGLDGDAQGDPKRHGGPDKALHHYPFDHYAHWRDVLPQPAILASAGAFGENLSTQGLTESDVAVGDTFRLGGSLIQVSQGRQPCWKLNERFGSPAMSTDVQRSGRTGWYYRVLEQGEIGKGDRLTLVDRLSPQWTIERLWRLFYVDTMDLDALRQVSELTHLPESWRGYAAKRLVSRQVEDWSRRLHGEPAAQPPDG